jgi:uncharacterized protein YkwD
MSRLKLLIVLRVAAGFVGSIWLFQDLSDSSIEEQTLTLQPQTETIETQADGQATDSIQEIEEQVFIPSSSIEEIPRIEVQAEEQSVEEQVSTPLSLETEEETPDSFLTQQGIIQWTNFQREQYGLPPLRENPELNASAQEKMEDMFEEQYFAHQSPSGEGAGDLVKLFGYEFIIIGENLALGNFQNDQNLVQAWMDSPGHRANILNVKYQEIGVAVGKGTFNGQATWLAVQHFALPLAACPQPDKTLLAKIEEDQSQIGELLATLTALQTEIQAVGPRRRPADNQNIEIYREKVEEYNLLVSQYNALIEETKDLVNQYNSQVKLFNECVI